MILHEGERTLAPALDAGLDVIEHLALKKEAGFNELCKILPMSKASVSRILKTLSARGYVKKDEARDKWLPGPRMSIAGLKAPVSETLRSEAPKILESFVEDAGNTAICVFWSGSEFQVVSKIQREGAVSMLDVGTVVRDLSKYPWGWLFYLSLDAQGRKAMAKSFEAPELFKRRIVAWSSFIASHGFALDDHEIFPGSRRMGAPIRDSAGAIVGALGTSGNKLTIPDSEIDRIGGSLLSHAGLLSKTIADSTSR